MHTWSDLVVIKVTINRDGSRSNLIRNLQLSDVNGHNSMQVYVVCSYIPLLDCFVTDYTNSNFFFMDSWRLNYAKIIIITISCCRTQNSFLVVH